MEIKDIQRSKDLEIAVKVKTTKERSSFMYLHDISPTALFNKAIDEVMENAPNNKRK